MCEYTHHALAYSTSTSLCSVIQTKAHTYTHGSRTHKHSTRLVSYPHLSVYDKHLLLTISLSQFDILSFLFLNFAIWLNTFTLIVFSLWFTLFHSQKDLKCFIEYSWRVLSHVHYSQFWWNIFLHFRHILFDIHTLSFVIHVKLRLQRLRQNPSKCQTITSTYERIEYP